MKYFIGISLNSNSTQEAGISVLDDNFNIISLEKFFSVDNMTHFFDNFSSLKNSTVCVSLPEDNTVLNAKWKVTAKNFQTIHNTNKIKNKQNWTNHYSSRGSDVLIKLKSKGIVVYRYEIKELKKALNLYGIYKERTSADCKYLQDYLKYKLKIKPIAQNMLPAGQLEAILGSYLAFQIDKNKNYEKSFIFNELDVLNIKNHE